MPVLKDGFLSRTERPFVAGTIECVARYGTLTSSETYKELVRITSWSDEDVAQDEQLTSNVVSPSFVIDSFPELTAIIEQIESWSQSRGKHGHSGDLCPKIYKKRCV